MINMREVEKMIRRVTGGNDRGLISRIRKFVDGCAEEVKRFLPC